MNAERLLTHYEQIADAPDAIPRMRMFILDLAMRGKLVPQDAGDEPASALLKRIAKEKVRLIKVGEARKERIVPELAEGFPFEVSSGWSWVPFGELHRLVRGVTYSKSDVSDVPAEGFLPILRANNIGVRLTHDDPVFVRRKRISPDQLLRRGDFMIALSSGSKNLVGKAAYVPDDFDEGFGGFCGVIRLYDQYLKGFVGVYLQSNLYRDSIAAGSRGIGINNLKMESISNLYFPLPPLAEQRRIVAKVDELMVLCDRLEAARAGREAVRDRLTAASFARLNAPDPATFHDDACFSLETLASLTMRPDQMKQFRQMILNLAVRGKLVPQDPSDEPAVELLAKTRKLPAAYQRRRKILKETSIDAPASLFPNLPHSWEYAEIQRLYDLNIIIDYADGNHGSFYPRSSEFGESGVTFVSAKDLAGGRVNWDSCSKLNENWAKQLTKGWAQTGDVLLTHNATVGRVARIEEQVDPFLLGTSVTFYRLNPEALSRNFFFYVLQSPLWQGQLEAIMAQTTRNQVSIQKQAFFRIVVPPLTEQHRIVLKIEALMALCDQLEASLTATFATRRRLLDALLSEALAPVDAREIRAAE